MKLGTPLSPAAYIAMKVIVSMVLTSRITNLSSFGGIKFS